MILAVWVNFVVIVHAGRHYDISALCSTRTNVVRNKCWVRMFYIHSEIMIFLLTECISNGSLTIKNVNEFYYPIQLKYESNWKCILYPLTDLDPEDAASICISLLDGIDNCLCSWKLKRTCIRRNTWTWNLQYFKKSNPKFLQLYPSKHLFYSNIGKSLVWGGK